MYSPLPKCYIKQEADGSWLGVCLTMNLYARADTSEEAEAKLYTIIQDHISTVMGYPEHSRMNLLDRPAPFQFWVDYVFWLVRQIIKW